MAADRAQAEPMPFGPAGIHVYVTPGEPFVWLELETPAGTLQMALPPEVAIQGARALLRAATDLAQGTVPEADAKTMGES